MAEDKITDDEIEDYKEAVKEFMGTLASAAGNRTNEDFVNVGEFEEALRILSRSINDIAAEIYKIKGKTNTHGYIINIGDNIRLITLCESSELIDVIKAMREEARAIIKMCYKEIAYGMEEPRVPKKAPPDDSGVMYG